MIITMKEKEKQLRLSQKELLFTNLTGKCCCLRISAFPSARTLYMKAYKEAGKPLPRSATHDLMAKKSPLYQSISNTLISAELLYLHCTTLLQKIQFINSSPTSLDRADLMAIRLMSSDFDYTYNKMLDKVLKLNISKLPQIVEQVYDDFNEEPQIIRCTLKIFK